MYFNTHVSTLISGTSVDEGMGICHAICEYLLNLKVRLINRIFKCIECITLTKYFLKFNFIYRDRSI